jgi:hypothetical protein
VLAHGAWSIHAQYPGIIDIAFALAGYDPHLARSLVCKM